MADIKTIIRETANKYRMRLNDNEERLLADAILSSFPVGQTDMVLVPREPTAEMMDAALALDEICKGVLVPASPYDVWQAMLSSSPDGGRDALQQCEKSLINKGFLNCSRADLC